MFQSKRIISKEAFSSSFRSWYEAKAILSKKRQTRIQFLLIRPHGQNLCITASKTEGKQWSHKKKVAPLKVILVWVECTTTIHFRNQSQFHSIPSSKLFRRI